MYTTMDYEAEISVEEYVQNYVDVETFLEACRACPNYDRVWSCPSYDFDVMAYWKHYKTLKLQARKIVFEKEYTEKTYGQEELTAFLNPVILQEKQKLGEKMRAEEEHYPGSISLAAGSCGRCKEGCTRTKGEKCRFPEDLRYSIESLGGNVGLTIEKLMGLKLEWIEEGRLPGHFVLVNGLLIP
ncbi:MAG: DUF2284 domain-containing protein [Treponema sp.]|nr:DUF2284 domain-containing protein [Treponema sp.]